MTRLLVLIALAWGLLLGTPGPAAADQGAPRVVRVGTEGTYPPFTYRDPETQQLTGFDIEVMRAVGAEAGWDVQFVEAPFDSLFPALDSGRIDVIANQVTINPEREARYLPSGSGKTTVLRSLNVLETRNPDEAAAEARTLLEQVGLAGREDAYPAQLSGGQQQRVGIARALALRPEVLLLDEPTSALDPELVGEVLAVIRDLATQGQTLVIVTHEVRFARDVADQALFLDQGVVAERGGVEVLTDPREERTRRFLQRCSTPGEGSPQLAANLRDQ